MGEMGHKVLLVNSEIFPYLPENGISKIGRYLPQGIQERKNEIRSFMPRYGCINERKNQLHEVIRLSGMNIVIDDSDRPLVIKVASISSARIQVYFIDNEDYFRRKQLVRDDNGFFPDNDERTIFFARGVLETVKKLRWAPDVIHCQGWISHLIPALLKKSYCDDPIFASSKVVLSLYDDTPKEKFDARFAEKAAFGNLTADDLSPLKESPDGIGLGKAAIRYADGIIMASDNIPESLSAAARESGLPVLPYDASLYDGDGYIDAYNGFYDKI